AFVVVTVAACVWSCSQPTSNEPAARDGVAVLGGDAAIRVTGTKASDLVPLHLVAEVAREQKISPEDAVRRLADDAVAAVAARDRGLDGMHPASWRLVSARARIVA